MPLHHWVVRAHGNGLRVFVLAFGNGDVFGDVNEHGAWPACTGEVEGLLHGDRQVFDVFDQEVVFDAGPGNANSVALLKGVKANGVGWYLASNNNHRNGVHIGRSDTCNGIGYPGPACNKADPNLFARASIGVGSMHCSLLVTHEDVLNGFLFEDFVVDVEHSPARIAKEVHYFFFLEATHQDFSAS